VNATPSGAADVTITVDSNLTTQISPWIYGLNFYTGVTGAPSRLTVDRAGGNRWTAYNWETNASNAGSDYFYQNDNYLSAWYHPAEGSSQLHRRGPGPWHGECDDRPNYRVGLRRRERAGERGESP